jgi:hypothetical protein
MQMVTNDLVVVMGVGGWENVNEMLVMGTEQIATKPKKRIIGWASQEPLHSDLSVDVKCSGEGGCKYFKIAGANTNNDKSTVTHPASKIGNIRFGTP